jgi:hypothetical protein
MDTNKRQASYRRVPVRMPGETPYEALMLYRRPGAEADPQQAVDFVLFGDLAGLADGGDGPADPADQVQVAGLERDDSPVSGGDQRARGDDDLTVAEVWTKVPRRGPTGA